MSYDVWIDVETGPNASVCAFDGNYTSNVSQMWNHALGDPPTQERKRDGGQPFTEWGLALFDGAPCSEAAGPLAAAVARMAANRDEYLQWEPDNGWGDYEGALNFLRDIAEATATHTRGTIRVS